MEIFGFELKKIKAEAKLPTNKTEVNSNQLHRALYQMLMENNVIKYDCDNTTFIKKGYNFNPHAYSVINFICRNISQVPFKAYKVTDKKHLRNYLETKGDDVLNKNLYRSKSLELVENSGLSQLLIRPNEVQGWSEFIFESIGFKKITGNAYTYGLEPVGFDGLYTKLYNMPSHITEIVSGTWQEPVKGYKIYWTFDKALEISKENILHQKEWNPDYQQDGSALYGLSPMQPLLRPLQRSNESYDASLALMANGAPAGVLSNEMDKVMAPEQVDLAQENLTKKFGGGKNKNKIAVSATKVNWQSIGLSSVDLEILESNNADLRDFCRVFGVPSVLISDTEQSTYNNVSEAKKSVWQELFIPELNSLRDGLNRWLVPGWSAKDGVDYFIDYDVAAIPALQINLQEASARLISEMEHGLWSPNEVRAMLGKEIGEDEKLNKRMLSANLIVVGEKKNQLLEILASVSPLVANKLLESLTPEQIATIFNTTKNE